MLRSVRGGRARRRVRSADGDTRFGGKASARHTCREINEGLPARLVRMGALFATGVIDADTVLDVYGVGAGQLAGASAAAFTATIGVALVVSYAVNLVCVLLVRRGVKDPAKMKLGMVLFGILSVLALVSLVKALLDGTGLEALTQSVATAVMNCCVFYGALKLNASAK